MKTMSVVIPAHNEEKYVARCIRSVKTAAASGDVIVTSALRDTLFHCTATICCAGCHLASRGFTAVSSGLRKRPFGK